jgi:bifunctional DNA-binding transcriptional regulator/antitoxin component of YhaV-PrlF toxin-antitoxin module
MKSKVNVNTPGGTSLRTTIPESVVETLEIQKGDTLDWTVKPEEGKMIAVVKKA